MLRHGRIVAEKLAGSYRPVRQQKFSTSDGTVKELTPTTTLLRNAATGAEVYLVGTAHISSQSAEEVRELIRLVKPSCVMLELCELRLKKLRGSGQAPTGFVKAFLSQLGMPGDLQGRLVGAGLSGMYGLLRTMGLEPGMEFKVAIEEAEKIGAEVVCGDQDQRVTAEKISQHLSLADLVNMAGSTAWVPPDLRESFAAPTAGLQDAVEALKTRESARRMSQAMRDLNPGIARALIDERDEILAASLLRMRGRCIGVVGLAHLDGIERLWRAEAR